MRSSAANKIMPDRYLVDEHGKPEAVVLSILDYRKMVRHMENLEDAVALKQAIRTSPGTLSHDQLIARLKTRKFL
jgi:hypothetical protein